MTPSAVPAGEIPVQLSRDQAIKVAAADIGLRSYEASKVSATVCTLSDQGVPFLVPFVGGRRTWRVEFHDINLARATGRAKLANPYITELVAVLAPATGHVLRVASTWPRGVPPMLPYPSRAEEEAQFGAIKLKFTGVPANAPSLSLMDAVGHDDFAHWSPDVKQILAYYVDETHLSIQDRPVWVVQVRGIPPFEPFGHHRGLSIPADFRNHYRNVIDARTGEWLEADTVPQPITPHLELRM